MPRPRAHAPNKQGGKPAGQDTSRYKAFAAFTNRFTVYKGFRRAEFL